MARRQRRRKSGTIHGAVRAAMARKGITGYGLAQALRGRVSRTAVYRFLGEGGTTNIATAEAFFEVLGLRVVGDE